MSCWTVLEINPTKDLKEIKKAYSKLLDYYSLEKNTNEYTKLTNAYIKAMSLVNTSVKDMSKCLSNNSIDYTYENIKSYCNDSLDNNDYILAFNNRLNEIYTEPSLRFSEDSWLELINSYMFINKDLISPLENDLINYLFSHKYIPHNIFLLLDKYLKFNDRSADLYKKYDKKVVDFLLKEINNPISLSYGYLSTITKDTIDTYLELREKAFLNINDKRAIEYLTKAYSLYSYDIDLLKLLGSYYLNKKDNISALRYFRESLEVDSGDLYCLVSFGHLLLQSKQYSKAITYLEKYVSKLKNDINLTALNDLALSYYYSYDYSKSLDLFKLLSKFNPKDKSIKQYINTIIEKLQKTHSEKSPSPPMYIRYINSQISPLLKDLDKIYNDFNLRISIDNWRSLLSYSVLFNENFFYYTEEIIVKYITNNKFIPNEVFALFSNHFNWLDRKEELLSIYNHDDIKLIFNELYQLNPLSYNHLKDIDASIANDYLELRNLSFSSLSKNKQDTLNYLNAAYKIYSKDFELYRLYGDYYLSLENYKHAETYYRQALSFNAASYYCMYRLGVILSYKKEYTKALSYLETLSFITKDLYFVHTEEFLTQISLSYYYTNNLKTAKKYFEKLAQVNGNLHFINIYLKNINYRLNGVNKREIDVSAISNPNYTNDSLIFKLFRNSKEKLSLLFN